MTEPQIKVEEWLAELERLSHKSGDGLLTTLELAEIAGLDVKTMRIRLHTAKKRGWLIHGKKSVEMLNGVLKAVDAYAIKKPKK